MLYLPPPPFLRLAGSLYINKATRQPQWMDYLMLNFEQTDGVGIA
jgi:hypothetical protein